MNTTSPVYAEHPAQLPVDHPIWKSIFQWDDARISEAVADAVSAVNKAVLDHARAYADATCAQRLAAVDAGVEGLTALKEVTDSLRDLLREVGKIPDHMLPDSVDANAFRNAHIALSSGCAALDKVIAPSGAAEVPIAPDFCPITGSKFWGNIEHPELGLVATYGGPFDTYTIPVLEKDGELRSERFDQDAGDWVEGGEPMGWFYDEQRSKTPSRRAVQGDDLQGATDAMVDAYLKAQREAVEEADKFGRPNVGGLHTNTVREACRAGLNAARAVSLATGASAQGDAKDAARWRELRRQHEGNEAAALCVFQDTEGGDLDPVGSLPGELDAAIDAAIASTVPKEPKP